MILVMLSGKTREKLAGQVKDAAERIGSGILGVLAVALAAVVVAAGALLVSLKCLKTVRA
jgi:hypothetical protein